MWFVFIIPFTYSQSDTVNRTDKFGKKYGYWEKRDNGKLLWKAYFYNGEPVGDFIHYYPNKKIKDKLYYYPNSPKVSAVSYYSNGVKSSEGIFINKIKDGKWLYYSNAGKLVSEENYKLGKKQGVFKLYSSENETLLQEETWENNQLHGEYKEYYTTGDIRLKWHYKNNKIDGPYESYYLNGAVWIKGQYAKGLREGTWNYYNRDGNEFKIEEILHEHVIRTVLGFKTLGGKWMKLDTKVIAYFYQNPGGNINIQLRNGKKVILDESNSLVDISNTAGPELFIFLNENLLSSYESIKIVTDIGDNEAEIILKPTPLFKVYSYDDYYNMLKLLLDTSTPEDHE
jgi:antitoxin component YwqK of YwqJK toxin-antitoxin module